MTPLIDAYQEDLREYRFEVKDFLPKRLFDTITDIRINNKQVVSEEAGKRRRRARLTTDGKLTILAADHPGRMITNYGNNPIQMGNRYNYLGRVLRVLLGSEMDGVMGTPDILEELMIVSWLYRKKYGKSFLDYRLMVGTMNRGGLIGTSFEMADRFTSFTAKAIHDLRLDGGKFMYRLEGNEVDCGEAMFDCSRAIKDLNRFGLAAFFEVLPVRKDSSGYPVKKDPESLVKLIGVATAMGDSSLNLWIKIPYCDQYATIAASTTCPILMLGGAATGNPIPTLEEFEKGLKEGRNVRGVLAGRNILYPGTDDPACVAQAAHQIVHKGQSVEAVIACMKEWRDRELDRLADLV
jgi:DhnA family fructose-bisphosphate aldolase class Ia